MTQTASSTTSQPSSPPTPPETPERSIPFADRFSRVVDLSIAADGLDSTDPIGGLLREYAADDTLLYLPPGEYRLEAPWQFSAFENLGFVGEDAVIVPPEGAHETFFGFGEPGRASGLVLAGLTFDFRAHETGGRPFEVQVDDGLIVEDITVVGRQDVRHQMMRFDVTAEDGEGVVRRMVLADGGIPEYRITGCYVGEASRGSLTFENCRIEGFPDNGLYASSASGPINVLGGHYANNGIASVRVGDQGLVRGVTVRCDDNSSGFSNMRGIRLDNGGTARIEDCTIEVTEVTDSNGGITLSPWMAGAVIRNTRIQVDVDRVPALWAKQPAERLENDPRIEIEGLEIEGGAGHGPTIEIDGRDRTSIRASSILQTGPNRDGILIQRSSDNVISDTSIDVTGEPLRLERAEAETANLDLPDEPTDEQSS